MCDSLMLALSGNSVRGMELVSYLYSLLVSCERMDGN